jgi:hypothetical protein
MQFEHLNYVEGCKWVSLISAIGFQVIYKFVLFRFNAPSIPEEDVGVCKGLTHYVEDGGGWLEIY